MRRSPFVPACPVRLGGEPGPARGWARLVRAGNRERMSQDGTTDRVLTAPNVLQPCACPGCRCSSGCCSPTRTAGRWACSGSRGSPTGPTARWPANSSQTSALGACSIRSPTGSTSWPRCSAWICGRRSLVAGRGAARRGSFIARAAPALGRGATPRCPCTYLGKAATFCLLYAFPLLLLGQFHGPVGRVAQPVGWAFTYWGTGLYWAAGLLYAAQTRQVLRDVPRPVRPAG